MKRLHALRTVLLLALAGGFIHIPAVQARTRMHTQAQVLAQTRKQIQMQAPELTQPQVQPQSLQHSQNQPQNQPQPQVQARAQAMSLDQVIDVARSQSVQALEARSEFVSDYWAWRSYLASRLPSVILYGNLGNFDRSLRLLQNYETGQMIYTENYNMQNSIGLRLRQNIGFTGGTVSLYTDLTRIDEFSNSGVTWYSQPITLSYTQPLFAYNQFKWAKLISPKEYERARRAYLESMEDVTISAVESYFSLMSAQMSHEAAKANFRNTSAMLSIAGTRMSLGSVSRDEYLQLELRSLNDSLAINDSYDALRQAQMAINSLLGYDESYEIYPLADDSLPDISMDYDFVLEKTMQNSSFNYENQINLLTAESAIAQAKADRGITMQLNATFGLSKTSSQFLEVYMNLPDQEVVGLSFSVPIFDWGEGRGKVKKAEAAAEVVKAQVQQAENDKRLALFTAVAQFNGQGRRCEVSRRARDIAAERYAIVMENFRSGTATVTDLNTARTESDTALQQYIEDLGDYWNYYYTLRKLTLYDFIGGTDIIVDYEEIAQ